MDVAKSVRLAVDSGKVELGFKKALKTSLNGGAKVIVIAANCPGKSRLKEYCEKSKIPLLEFQGNGMELGAVCGKPFSISALSVVDILKKAVGKTG